jgi:hypothetical protein
MPRLIFVICLALAACQGAPSQSSCDGRTQGLALCDDKTSNPNDEPVATLEAQCIGTFSTSLCDHTGSLGACVCDPCLNGRLIEWWFPNSDAGIATAADVMARCHAENSTYQAP